MIKLQILDPHLLPHIGGKLNISANDGEVHILIGENGLGKTTLLQRFFRETKESVLIEQKMTPHFYNRTLEQFRKVFLAATIDNKEIFNEHWQLFGFHLKEQRMLSELSGGESQLLKLVCGFSKESSLYFLDEPSQYLDTPNKKKLAEIISKFSNEGKIFIMVEHDIQWFLAGWNVHKLTAKNNSIIEETSWKI